MVSVVDRTDPFVKIIFDCHEPPFTLPNSSQRCQIAKTKSYGEALFIEGTLQSALSDEYIYHEMFVHSLLIGLKKPKRVLILGGGEGCILREVLKWGAVQHITQVDWDQNLISYFANEGVHWNRGAYSDSKVNLVYEDALVWLSNTTELFDAIFIDLFDPVDNHSLSFLLDVTSMAKMHLNPGGGISVNGGPVTTANNFAKELKSVFTDTYFERLAIRISVPSFMGDWTLFCMVPRLWSSTLLNISEPKNLKRFTKDELYKSSRWSKDSPSDVQDFWKKNNYKKLDSLTIVDSFSDRYGC